MKLGDLQIDILSDGVFRLDGGAMFGVVPRALWDPFVRLLSVYAPHMGEELWSRLGKETSVSRANWPQWAEVLAREKVVTVVCQVNGKVRSKLEVSAGTSAEDLQAQALAQENVRRYTDGKEIVKVIAIPDRLVNIVVR